MKNIIFRQTWAILVAVLATVIGGLIINSFTKWWADLANITSAGWVATSEGLARTITYKVPIWAVVAGVVLVALAWYAAQIIRRATNITTPNTTSNFLNYREDVFDGVLCRWDYIRTSSGSQIGEIVCFCQHCDFVIGTPNRHEQRCSSCSRRAVKCGNTLFYTNNILQDVIAGYKWRENPMPFKSFISLEIDRRIRTGECSRPEKTEIT